MNHLHDHLWKWTTILFVLALVSGLSLQHSVHWMQNILLAPVERILDDVLVIDRPLNVAPSASRVLLEGDDVNVTNDNLPQLEPSIAVDPTNSNNLVAVYFGVSPEGEQRCLYSYSKDGGATWQPTQTYPDLPLTSSADPVVAVTKNGTFYITCLNLALVDLDAMFSIHRSDDGGETWGNVVSAFSTSGNDFVDKQWITVDQTNGVHQNRLYLAFMYIPDTEQQATEIHVTYSDDGANFVTPNQVSDDSANLNQGAFPAVGGDGTVYVSWRGIDINSSANKIMFDRSTDGGNTWATDIAVSDISLLPERTINGFYRVVTIPAMDVDRSNGPHRNNIYIVWADYRNDDSDIYLAISSNQGQSWDIKRLNDDPIRNGKDQVYPFIMVDKNGTVRAMWFDRRDDPANALVHVYYTESKDGGATFSRNFRISDVSFDPSYAIKQKGGFLGDYFSLASDGINAYAIWSDTREEQKNESDIFVDVITPDEDGDQIQNVNDNCPADANPNQEDDDGDDFGNPCDPCPDDPENDCDGRGICASEVTPAQNSKSVSLLSLLPVLFLAWNLKRRTTR